MIAGLKGYEKKVYNSNKPSGRKIRRTAKESSGARAQMKLTAKTEWESEWDRKRSKDVEEDFDLDDGEPESNSRKRKRVYRNEDENIPEGWKQKEKVKEKDKDVPDGWKITKTGRVVKTLSLMIIVGSMRGELATNLRSVTQRMKLIVGYNTKIVVRGQKDEELTVQEQSMERPPLWQAEVSALRPARQFHGKL